MEIWCVQFHTLLFNIKTLAGQETTPNLKKNSRGFLKKAKRTYKLSPGIIHIYLGAPFRNRRHNQQETHCDSSI